MIEVYAVGVQKTSIDSYHELIESGKLSNKKKMVIGFLLLWGPLTNYELAKRANLPINQITGRIKELREEGYITPMGEKKNEHTQKTNIIWGLK